MPNERSARCWTAILFNRLKKVRNFVQTLEGQLKLFFLPPYPPELNRDDLVWTVITGQVSGCAVVEDKLTRRWAVPGVLRHLQRSTEKLKQLVHGPSVACILAECRVYNWPIG